MPWKIRKECKEGGASFLKKERGSEDVWGEFMEVEDETSLG